MYYVIFNNICIFWNDNFKNKIDRINSLFFRNYFMSHAIISFYILSTILSLSSLPTNRNEENDNLFINNNSNQFTVDKRL